MMDRNALAINRQRSVINNALARNQAAMDPSEINADQGRALLDGLWNFGGGAQNGNQTGVVGKLLGQIPGMDVDGQRAAQSVPDAIANTAHTLSPSGLFDMAAAPFHAADRLMTPRDAVDEAYRYGDSAPTPYTNGAKALDAFGVASALPAGGMLARTPEGAVGSNALRREGEPIKAYRGQGAPLGDGELMRDMSYWTDSPQHASGYATGDQPVVYPAHINADGFKKVNWSSETDGGLYSSHLDKEVRRAKEAGYPGIILSHVVEDGVNLPSAPHSQIVPFKPGTVKSATTGETLFSNPTDPTLAALGLMTNQNQPSQPSNALARRY